MNNEKKKGTEVVVTAPKDSKSDVITKVLQDLRKFTVRPKTKNVVVRVLADPRKLINQKDDSSQVLLKHNTSRNHKHRVNALRKTKSRVAMRHFLSDIEKSTPKPFQEVSRNLAQKSAESMERFKSLFDAR